MRRILVLVAVGLFLSLLIPHGAWAFGVKDVVMMSQDRIPDSLVIEKIQHSGARFAPDARDFHTLKVAGVSDEVVVAMLRTEDSGYPGGYPVGYYPPYYAPWYLGLDFDFGHYGPYHHAYAPIYRRRGYGGFGRGSYGGGRHR
jgi:hypothetical protein